MQDFKKRAIRNAILVFIFISTFGVLRLFYSLETGNEWLVLVIFFIAFIVSMLFYFNDLRRYNYRLEKQHMDRQQMAEKEGRFLKWFVFFSITMFVFGYFFSLTYIGGSFDYLIIFTIPAIILILVIVYDWKRRIKRILTDDDYFEIYKLY